MRDVSSTKQSGKLIGVQFGRGIAASFVVFHHADRMLGLPQYIGHVPLNGFFFFGNTGVDFFFTLSGFIIFYVHEHDLDRPEKLGRYIWRRVTRIYPLYWLVTAVVVALAIAKADWGSLGATHLIKSLLLIKEVQDPVLGVGWTLTHEVLFYAVFATAILSRNIGIFLGLVWMGFTLDGIVEPNTNLALVFVSSPYHFQFAMGVICAFLVRRWVPRRVWLVALTGIVLFAANAVLLDLHTLRYSEPLCRILFGVSSALVIYGVAAWEGEGGIQFPKWAEFLGASSYSIYLVNTIAIGNLAKLGILVHLQRVGGDLFFLCISFGTIAIGCAVYKLAEAPIQHFVREVEVRRPTAALVPFVTGLGAMRRRRTSAHLSSRRQIPRFAERLPADGVADPRSVATPNSVVADAVRDVRTVVEG
jgi:exopolysaccharide production protein ExoZ